MVVWLCRADLSSATFQHQLQLGATTADLSQLSFPPITSAQQPDPGLDNKNVKKMGKKAAVASAAAAQQQAVAMASQQQAIAPAAAAGMTAQGTTSLGTTSLGLGTRATLRRLRPGSLWSTWTPRLIPTTTPL